MQRASIPTNTVLLRKNQSEQDALRQQTHLTTVLLIVPLAFFILNAASYLLRMNAFVLWLTSTQMPVVLIPVHNVAVLLHYSSFGVNLVVYTLASTNFRRALRKCVYSMLVQCGCKRFEHQSSATLRNNTCATAQQTSKQMVEKRPLGQVRLFEFSFIKNTFGKFRVVTKSHCLKGNISLRWNVR